MSVLVPAIEANTTVFHHKTPGQPLTAVQAWCETLAIWQIEPFIDVPPQTGIMEFRWPHSACFIPIRKTPRPSFSLDIVKAIRTIIDLIETGHFVRQVIKPNPEPISAPPLYTGAELLA
jgi:hypothetical protein